MPAFASWLAVVALSMGRDALNQAQMLAQLIERGQISTALNQLSKVHPPRLQNAVVRQLEKLLSDENVRWFWKQWLRLH